MSKVCCHSYVSGKVQGVFFRAHTKEKAIELGVKGWVRNLPDGRVEVFACGEKSAIDKLESWLHIGPDIAKVDSVVSELEKYQDFADFRVI